MQHRPPRWPALALVLLALVAFSAPAIAGPREQARRMHDRLIGVPPSETTLAAMAQLVTNQQEIAAAELAMQHPVFYTSTLKNWVTPWTNVPASVFEPLNDYTATVIGMIRDDVDFSTLLSADLTYVGVGGVVSAAPSASNNDHYAQLESNNVDLTLPANFASTSQSSVQGIPSTATAGIMTSRAASEAFFIAGTNRAMFRFTLLNHMCNDMEQMHDTSLIPDRIRQDVSRSPGGDSRLFLNSCVGCHTGMDPMAGAFAYYDYDETSQRLVYTASNVQSKYFNNDLNFPQGYRTTDDSWENYWREGQNSYLGFDGNLSGAGNGAKSMGQELGNSYAFAACQVKKVFRAVCLRDAENQTDRNAVDAIVTSFRNSGYRMKQVFADTAVHCMGQ